MNDELAQNITLALYGTAYLKGTLTADAVNNLEQTHPVFSRLFSIKFEDKEAGYSSVFDWFQALKNSDIERVTVRRPWNTHQLASATHYAGTGGLQLGTQARGNTLTRWWQSFAQLSRAAMNQQAIDPTVERIWQVVFRVSGVSRDVQPVISFEEAHRRLSHALIAARELAVQHKALNKWQGNFEAAIAHLQHQRKTQAHDLAPPPDTPAEISQLLAAGSKAWVFGTSGDDWNDIPVKMELRESHSKVTRELFGAVMSAFEVAVETETVRQ